MFKLSGGMSLTAKHEQEQASLFPTKWQTLQGFRNSFGRDKSRRCSLPSVLRCLGHQLVATFGQYFTGQELIPANHYLLHRVIHCGGIDVTDGLRVLADEGFYFFVVF